MARLGAITRAKPAVSSLRRCPRSRRSSPRRCRRRRSLPTADSSRAAASSSTSSSPAQHALARPRDHEQLRMPWALCCCRRPLLQQVPLRPHALRQVGLQPQRPARRRHAPQLPKCHWVGVGCCLRSVLRRLARAPRRRALAECAPLTLRLAHKRRPSRIPHMRSGARRSFRTTACARPFSASTTAPTDAPTASRATTGCGEM